MQMTHGEINMYYAILIIIAVLCFIGAVTEASKRKKLEARNKHYIEELNDERSWSDKILDERNTALDRCEELADENASLAHEAANLRKRTVEYAFSDWKRIEDVTGVRDYYLEKDGIRIIIEDGKTVGWYRP